MNNKSIKIITIICLLLTLLVSIICFFINMLCGFLCLALGLIVLIIFIYYTKKRYDKIKALNTYLSLICAGNYNLDINENTEGELSILKNNLYKVITILQSQKDLLEKDKLYLSNSLADISHQLKTPLTSMMVMTELLREEKDENRRTEFLTIIETQLDRMKWLILNLLKISKLDAGTADFKYEEVSVKKVIDKSLNSFLITFDLKQIDVESNITDFYFKGDKNWSVEAFENIIKNCIEHTKKNGKITISSKQNNVYNSIMIKDNGCGISKEDLPHIFERFYHGKNSSKDSVGIGLALAKTIFEKENAKIYVESVENKGTTFEIKFYKSII